VVVIVIVSAVPVTAGTMIMTPGSVRRVASVIVV
jgi:hypothetical protein